MKLIPVAILALASCATHCPFYNPVYKVLPLQYASADLVAQKVASEEKAAAPDALLEIVADSRQNSVIVEGPEDDVARVVRRIRELDVR